MVPKLTYFHAEGRAEATRLALTVGGIEFEDNRITGPEFGALKKDLPWGTLPVMTLNGEDIAQSTALLRWAGKTGGLYPSDAFDALKVDEIVMAGEDFCALIFTAFPEPPEKKKEMLEAMSAGKLPQWLKVLAKKLEANTSSPYFVGDTLTIADLQIFVVVRLLESGDMEYIPTSLVTDTAPTLKKHYDTVMSNPKIKAWYESKA